MNADVESFKHVEYEPISQTTKTTKISIWYRYMPAVTAWWVKMILYCNACVFLITSWRNFVDKILSLVRILDAILDRMNDRAYVRNRRVKISMFEKLWLKLITKYWCLAFFYKIWTYEHYKHSKFDNAVNIRIKLMYCTNIFFLNLFYSIQDVYFLWKIFVLLGYIKTMYSSKLYIYIQILEAWQHLCIFYNFETMRWCKSNNHSS